MRPSYCCFVLALILVAAPLAALDTVFLVRHAEKETPWPRAHSTFQPLNDAGRARAQALAGQLDAVGIAAVYTSPTGRTLQTGMPLAHALEVPIEAEEATIDDQALGGFLDELRERHADDRAVLIVGHSNTIAPILVALGADADCHARLGVDGEGMIEGYEGLWRVDLARPGCVGMVRLDQAASEAVAGDAD